MRLWQVYPPCPRCKAEAGQPCRSQRRGFEGRPRKNPCEERIRLLGGDRWAQPGEISCGAGGCRNLALWVIKTFYRQRGQLEQADRPWLSCGLHRAARVSLLRERHRRGSLSATFEVEPFQDPTVRPSGKTNKLSRTS